MPHAAPESTPSVQHLFELPVIDPRQFDGRLLSYELDPRISLLPACLKAIHAPEMFGDLADPVIPSAPSEPAPQVDAVENRRMATGACCKDILIERARINEVPRIVDILPTHDSTN